MSIDGYSALFQSVIEQDKAKFLTHTGGAQCKVSIWYVHDRVLSTCHACKMRNVLAQQQPVDAGDPLSLNVRGGGSGG